MNRRLITHFLVGFFVVIASLSQAQDAKEAYPVSIHDQAQIWDLGKEFVPLIKLLSEPSENRFEPLPNPNTNLGFTDHHYWVKFSLENTDSKTKTLYLETARPITDVADLYLQAEGQEPLIIQNGDMMPFVDREISHRKLLFPITLTPNSSTEFFLHLKSDGEVINLPLVLHDGTSLIESTFTDQLVFGVFYGILLLAALTYLFFYFGIKEKSFILYVSYVISIALLHSSLDGYFFQYILGTPGWFADRSLLIFATVSAILLNRYSQAFVQVKTFAKGLNATINVVNFSLALLLVGILLYDAGKPLYYPLVNALGFIGVLLAVASIVMSFFKRKPVDAFFALGFTSLTLGFVIFILNNFSLIENSFLTENSAKLGTGLEILFLSLSMANRIRILRTEKEKAQELALQRSEESNEIKSFFLSNVSHELRTPLNAILGLSQSIMKEIQDEKIKENLEVIKYSSVSLLSSIDDILDYSKIEKGELNLEQKTFDFQKVLNEIKLLAYQQTRDKGLKFIVEEKVQLPKKLIGDATRFRQILMNVIHNSIKFTNQGEVKLAITDLIESGSNSILSFEISDTGVGIKPEKLDRIFESFIQEQIDDKRKFGGFGLGLCIVKALTQLYSGTVAIQSEVGKGTKVSISLTFGKAEESVQDPIKAHSETLLLGKRILVVEDNPVNQLVIKSILRKWKGITFDFANHGLEGLEKLQQSHFDLILMDLQMPEMDGYEATEAIRAGSAGEKYLTIPIIAVTADTTEKSKVKAKAVGMDDYMTKPVDAEILLEKVLQALFLENVQLEKL
ncbi:hybrid sensor histidine kinase/response regulator [Algoriphagus sp. AK58]|uniref:hybrid sensor histidine kinase/response regulator n=1 Tax=Algoriphagus sp. AK58 TaxID=1406877 RepID=UPI00164F2096|nr:hybrid sensor histidine kinase/response regulator [Algoriphagus sp. AK58]MBC6367907.1 hybrid sensor histidine kinase/response regulator [Algoriphagus sp. AK58]